MNVLVINGSPKNEKSDCMRMTRAFLSGMNVQAEVLWAHAMDVKPCRGCFCCWQNDGKCAIDDDMSMLLDKLTASDVVIWSFPLYCYGMPAPVKAIVDRLLPLSTPKQEVDKNGRTYHPKRCARAPRFVLISGSGFPNIEHNFEGLSFQFRMLFGENSPQILCPESPLLNIQEAAPVADAYLTLVERAGREFAETGNIATETLEALKVPMIDPDAYRRSSTGD